MSVRVRRILALAEAVALVAMVLVLWVGFTNQLDLHPMDEAHYLSQGRAILRGELGAVSPGWCPISALVYAVLLLAPLGSALPPDVMLVAVAVVSTLAAWWLLRTLVAPWVAGLGACAWALAPSLLPTDAATAGTSPYALTAALCFAALAALQCRRWRLAWILFALAAVNRTEAAPWLTVAGAVAAWLGARGSGERRFGLALGLLGLAVTGLVVLHPDCRARAWLTFRYSYPLVRQRGLPLAQQRATLFVDEDLIAQTFPGATSIVSAAVANPDAFFAHVGGNVAALPETVRTLIAGPRHLPLPDWLPAALLVSAAAVGVTRCRRRCAHAWRSLTVSVRCVLCTGPLILAGLLIAIPRPAYVLPLWAPLALALLIPGAAALAGVRARVVRRLPWSRLLGPALPLAVACLLPAPFPAVAGVHREMREAVRLLRRARLPAGGRLYARFAPGMLSIADRQDVPYTDLLAFAGAGDTAASLRQALATQPPDVVLFTSLIPMTMGPAAELLQDELAQERWQITDISPGLLAILYRRAP